MKNSPRKHKKARTFSLLRYYFIGLLLFVIAALFLQSFHGKNRVLGQTTGGAIPSFSHVFVIIEENHSYSEIINNPAAPFINKIANQYGLAANYMAITHPSLPNYIALTSGGTQGITNDCNTCFLNNVNNIFSAVEAAGKTWKSYHETMPSNCDLQDVGSYVLHHNPAAYYLQLRQSCATQDVPYSDLANDLVSGNVPDLSFIIPNNTDDMHSGSIQGGDSYLSTQLPKILNSSAFQNNGVVFLTFDEGNDTISPNQVATIVISPLAKTSFISHVSYNHYSLLRTIADGLGVTSPGAAAQATPMSDFFTGGTIGTSPTGVSPSQNISPSQSVSPSLSPSVSPSQTVTNSPTITKPAPSQTPCPLSPTGTTNAANLGTFNPTKIVPEVKPCHTIKNKKKEEKDNDKKKKDKEPKKSEKDKNSDKETKPDVLSSVFTAITQFLMNIFK